MVLICVSLMMSDVQHLFMTVGHLDVYTGEMSVHVFCPFLICGVFGGRLGGAVVKCLPLAWDVIPALWDRAPHQAPLL